MLPEPKFRERRQTRCQARLVFQAKQGRFQPRRIQTYRSPDHCRQVDGGYSGNLELEMVTRRAAVNQFKELGITHDDQGHVRAGRGSGIENSPGPPRIQSRASRIRPYVLQRNEPPR